MAAQSSLYNEERNLLRIRERERRNQGVLQEKEPLPDQAPLFPEPYKTSKGDELSNRIQSMLGNYEEVKELIGANRNESFIGIPKSVVPSALQSKSDKPNEVSRHSFHSGTHRPIGTSNISSGHRHRPHAETALTAGHLAKSHTSAQGQVEDRRTREQQTGSKPMDKSGRRARECSAEQLSPSSISALSPLLSSLSPPGEPLSPLHSSHEMDSKPQDGQSHEETYSHVNKSPYLYDVGRKDGGSSVTNLLPSTQTFPTSLTSKNNVMPQKPTAYVRPMDGLDQAPNHSPDLKTLQEGYDGEPYVTYADLKVKEKLSRSEIPSGQFETYSNEAQCVEEILKEMTHSWPPPLTAIHTPRAAEPSKFSFPTKEIQQIPSVNQKQYDTSSKVLPSPQQSNFMLQDDLQISDSDDSDEGENSEKISSSSVPSSVQQSQADSVVSADSGSVASESSESDSSSDSENESSSSDNEVKQPTRTVSVELSTSSTSIWHLNNWMKPSASTESQSIEDHEQPNHWDSKEEEIQKTVEPHHKKLTWTSQDEIPNKISHSQSPVPKENITPRQTVGIKQPRKTVKALVTEEPKGGLTVESEPAPYRPRDQPSKEKPTVKTKERTKSNHCKEPKGSSAHTSEKKHKSSRHGGSSKKCLKIQSDKGHSAPPSPQIPPSPKGQSKANHRTSLAHPAVVVCEDIRGDKVLLPIGDRLLQPLSSKPLSLVVRIDLTLLSRLPGICGNISQSKRENGIDQGLYFKKEASETKKLKKQSKEHSKSKVDDCDKNSKKKKIKVESETNAATSRHKELSTEKLPKKSSEKLHKEHRSQKAMSQPGPTQKSAQRHAQKRRPSESSICSQQSTTSSVKSNHKEPSSAKHRRVDEKVSERAKSNKASSENKITPSPVPSLPNGNAKPTRPQLKFEEKLYTSDHYMNEAKKLKHKADAMSSKIGKAFNYLDAAMYFIECGIAMESDVQTPKPAYTMFAETVDLIKFIMKQNNFTDRSAPAHEKALATLCMRCQSVLFMAMFRYKKDTVFKYSRTLGEHFKSSSRAAQAPSQCVSRSTGTPSPLSQTHTSASSGGSQSRSIPSNNGGQGSSINIPQVIHQVASSYVNITSYFLNAYDIWEQADLLAKENKEFFADLSASVCPLALNSTMIQLVHYTKQGLQWLRLESGMT
ncbi:AF4/FMR2 family member 1 isoform X2 [Pelobates fuscus]|uniref:AF4/FMR2 family member 1 isoform X2 n=1 Tax=Pelobates fuscus TaxID=191477 RepID=UPI002FE4D30A